MPVFCRYLESSVKAGVRKKEVKTKMTMLMHCDSYDMGNLFLEQTKSHILNKVKDRQEDKELFPLSFSDISQSSKRHQPLHAAKSNFIIKLYSAKFLKKPMEYYQCHSSTKKLHIIHTVDSFHVAHLEF